MGNASRHAGGLPSSVLDDCGIPIRQPHVQGEGVHTYGAAEVNGDVKARSVAGLAQVKAVYEGLRPTRLRLAVHYANEALQQPRAESVAGRPTPWAAPSAQGGVERPPLPCAARGEWRGKLELVDRLEAQVNVVVSILDYGALRPRERRASPRAHGGDANPT